MVRDWIADRRRRPSCSRARSSRPPAPAASTSATTGCRRSRPRPSGRTVIGFSAAGTSEFVNAGVAERFSADAAGTLRAPQLYHGAAARLQPARRSGLGGHAAGGGAVPRPRSSTGATARRSGRFSSSPTRPIRTRCRSAGRSVPAAPTPVSVTPSVVASGVASINLQVTATSSGGDGLLRSRRRVTCAGSRASIPGVTVNSVTRDRADDGDDQRLDGERDARAQADHDHQSGRARAASSGADPPRDARARSWPSSRPSPGPVGQPVTVRGLGGRRHGGDRNRRRRGARVRHPAGGAAGVPRRGDLRAVASGHRRGARRAVHGVGVHADRAVGAAAWPVHASSSTRTARRPARSTPQRRWR